MKHFSIYMAMFVVVSVLGLLSVVSCSDGATGSEITDPDKPASSEEIKNVLNSAVTKWGMSQDEVRSSMKKYVEVNSSDNNTLIYKSAKGRQGVSYRFNEGRLCATSIVFPSTSTEIDLQSIMQKYSFVGELGGGKVYGSQTDNTLATVWNNTDYDSTLCAVGFAPIKTDLFEDVAPIVVTTNGNAVTDVCFATVSGKVTGVDKDVEVGMIYGRDADLTETSGTKISTTSRGEFNVKIKGLIDEQKYYYRAYALVDDIYYFGEVKSLVSKPITYTLDGRTFKMVRVEGGTMPAFYMMQTELPSTSDVTIGSFHFDKFNKNTAAVTLYNFGTFLKAVRESTGIPFRLPTKEEWQYAASGGQKSSKTIYSGSDNIGDVAWYQSNSGNKIHAVATKAPNSIGLYDMSGNYAEVCNETDNIYDVDGPICGGSWKSSASDCQVTSWTEGKTSGKIPNSNYYERHAFDARYITVRLVYSAE